MMSAFASVGRLVAALGLCAAITPVVWAQASHGAHGHPAAASAAAVDAEAAGVTVQMPWARATVPGQQAGGVFLKLQAREAAKLVGVESSASSHGEVHEMRMENDVMRMRAVESLALPAGETVELRPGGYHLMLMGLKAPLEAGRTIAVTLWIEDAAGQRHALPLQVPVRALNAAQGSGHGGGHGAGGHMKH